MLEQLERNDIWGGPKEGSNMKTVISIFAVTLALGFTLPAFAGDEETPEQCQKAGGT